LARRPGMWAGRSVPNVAAGMPRRLGFQTDAARTSPRTRTFAIKGDGAYPSSVRGRHAPRAAGAPDECRAASTPPRRPSPVLPDGPPEDVDVQVDRTMTVGRLPLLGGPGEGSRSNTPIRRARHAQARRDRGNRCRREVPAARPRAGAALLLRARLYERALRAQDESPPTVRRR